jgi:hypothetical protein
MKLTDSFQASVEECHHGGAERGPLALTADTLPTAQIPSGEAAIFDAFQFRARHERRGEQSYIIAVTRQD